MAYPNSRQEDYGYCSGLDSTFSRTSYIADDGGSSAGHVGKYTYLGLGKSKGEKVIGQLRNMLI